MENQRAQLRVGRCQYWATHDGQRRFLLCMGGLLVLRLLFLTDGVTHLWALSAHNLAFDLIFRIAKLFGRAPFAFALGIILYAVGKFRGREKLRRAGRLIICSVLLSGLIVLIAKPLFGRHENLHAITQNTHAARTVSTVIDERWGRFPSGDSTVAFATAAALAVEFSAATGAVMFLAALTAIGRVYGNIHLASDVFAGGCLGWGVTQWLSQRSYCAH